MEKDGEGISDGRSDGKTSTKEYGSSEFGNGLYYLWHLQVVGLIKGDALDPKCELKGKEAKVAIIDNGCARRHPNLQRRDSDCTVDDIIDRADFAYDWAGMAFDGWIATLNQAHINFGTLDLKPKDLAGVDADRLLKAFGNVNKAPNELPGHKPEPPQDPSARFSNHGTSCAGLVAGRPQQELDDKKKNPWAIEYYGANPKATIIPINTPYNHEYVPLTLALLHAVRFKADVILIPRAAMDPTLPPTIGSTDPRYTRFTDDADLADDKKIFELVLKKVSAKIPVVVAAGNDGGDGLQYPASLVKSSCPNLIVVGACNARGFRSSYSMGGQDTDDQGVTVYAPSDDAEELSKTYMRYNDAWWRGRQLKLELGAHQGNPDGAPVEKDNRYSPYGVLAIDIPGTFGRGGTAHEDELEYDDPGQSVDGKFGNPTGDDPTDTEYKPGSLYSVFGGTSAAASIVAGIVSLKVDGLAEPKGANAKAFVLQNVVPSSAASGIDKKTEAKGSDTVKVIDGSKYL